MLLTKEKLYADLLIAFMCAKKHKSCKGYVNRFEENLQENLSILTDELIERRYKPLPSSCFLVEYPKLREIFAADFRDRIVHHLIFNYVHVLFERTFIYDSYSCIKDRGTHFGIKRLSHFIRSCSQNYTKPCYAMKLDIRGYFMHIDREILYQIIERTMLRMKNHKIHEGDIIWDDLLDFDFLLYIIKEVIMIEPTQGCIIKGSVTLWKNLPRSKSLFYSPKGCGLPIGNLTSQLFSNVYLNEFDQYVKRELNCKYYGRYVDDSYIIHNDRDYLHQIYPLLEKFLNEKLHIQLNKGKTHITKCKQGVEFLGGFVKPNRTYISSQSLRRMFSKLPMMKLKSDEKMFSSINSLLGILRHYKSFNFRKELLNSLPYQRFSKINKDYTVIERYPWKLSLEKQKKFDEMIKKRKFF